MNKPEMHRHGTQNPYNWEGVMEFLYNEYQHSAQKQNIWALQRNSLKQNITQLQAKILALQNMNRQLKNRNNVLEHSLRQIKIKSHEKKNKQNQLIDQSNNPSFNQEIIQQLPKVPQRRPKPNRANLSKMLCSLGIPELLQDIKKDLQSSPSQTLNNSKPEGKKGFQLDLSKMQVDAKHTQNLQKNLSYEVVTTFEGHQDGVREAVFLNFNNELKQIASVSEDSTLKVWEIKKDSFGRIQKGECIETIRDHSGPIFTCVEGDGYLFTGGMEGVIRAYNFSQYSRDKHQLIMKWRTDEEDEKLEPLWQLVYDKQNVILSQKQKLLIATASQMAIKGYKIPSIQDEKISSNLKIKPYCHFLYQPKNVSNEQFEEFIPTAVCLSNSNLVVSYFNTNSLVHYDIETQKILNQINYHIDSNLSANKLVSHPKCVIGAYEDTYVRLFDSHKMVDSFKAHNQPVMGVSLHGNQPNSLFSCSQDGSVRLWDLRRVDKHVWETMGHQKKNDEAVHFIQTNFDGVTVSGGADSVLKIYAPLN